ncbi:MAG: PASTA domain-containing protein, partial [Actinomycetota bacterium]|nr:PASTA domain-containing protein [Actinomycetota bacterium]
RSNAGWYLLLVVALLVLAGVIGLAVAQNLDDSAPPTTPGSTSTSAEQTSAEQTTTSESTSTETTTEATTTTAETTTTEPSEETIVLDVEQYRGRDIADVTADLEGQGFTVVEDPVPNDQFPDGVVITLTPNGEVPVGSEITVRFVENGEGDGDGDG